MKDIREYAPGAFVKTILTACLIMIMAPMQISCTRTIYLPKESEIIRADTIKKIENHRDSILIRDSVSIYIRGDTVKIRETKIRYLERLRTDTVYKSKTDTLRIRETVAVEKERRSERFDSICRIILTGLGGGILISAILIGLVKMGMSIAGKKLKK
ncbi:MAG: hypothetical protein K2M87_03185 [Muribaculaceae bacterium]|nr:hypothetical protein [Muribaculaceae bacterium]